MIPILYPVNVLAPPSVVTTTGAAAGFPNRRLYDGDIGLLWRDSAAGTRDITVDGGFARTIDTVILGAGHTLAGLTVTVLSGATAGGVTSRTSFTVGDPGVPHRHPFGPVTDRWWVVRVASPSLAPAIPELVLSLGTPFPSSPVLRGHEVGQRSQVIDLESYGGYEWNLVRGPVRWTASYPLLQMTPAERDTMLAAHRALDGGARACYLTDGEGVTRWVNWSDRHVRLTSATPARYDALLQFREVLGAP
jgi:hypothetical protein